MTADGTVHGGVIAYGALRGQLGFLAAARWPSPSRPAALRPRRLGRRRAPGPDPRQRRGRPGAGRRPPDPHASETRQRRSDRPATVSPAPVGSAPIRHVPGPAAAVHGLSGPQQRHCLLRRDGLGSFGIGLPAAADVQPHRGARGCGFDAPQIGAGRPGRAEAVVVFTRDGLDQWVRRPERDAVGAGDGRLVGLRVDAFVEADLARAVQ